jgi:hypothetical protein
MQLLLKEQPRLSQSALVAIITVSTKEYGLIRLLNEFMPSKDSPTVN